MSNAPQKRNAPTPKFAAVNADKFPPQKREAMPSADVQAATYGYDRNKIMDQITPDWFILDSVTGNAILASDNKNALNNIVQAMNRINPFRFYLLEVI